MLGSTKCLSKGMNSTQALVQIIRNPANTTKSEITSLTHHCLPRGPHSTDTQKKEVYT